MPTIFSPYRICPIGAHIDHQGGVVLGRTLGLGTTLDYEPILSREIHLVSEQFGETRFIIGDEVDTSHWARYARAAALVFGDKLYRGLRAHVSGALVGAGLSSSAAVGLAYLKALADVNGLEVTAEELVWLDFQLENGQLGLQNGILDPLTIVHGKKDALLWMDTATGAVTPIPDPEPVPPSWIVAYSGVSRELTKSGFNLRVAECHEAASQLHPGARKLADVPRERYKEKNASLPENLRRRADHFYTEVERVQQGAQAWKESDLEMFGRLMNQSCASSINNYESGSSLLVELHQIASKAAGVYGSRFSGGGYGGCVVALANRAQAVGAAHEIAEKLAVRHPDLPSRVFVAEMGDGLYPGPVSPLAGEGTDSPPPAEEGTEVRANG
jgi:galactokinase/galacturonokinase